MIVMSTRRLGPRVEQRQAKTAGTGNVMVKRYKPSFRSTLQAIGALLAKDFRFFRVPMIAMIILGCSCYIVALMTMDEPSVAQESRGWKHVNPEQFVHAAEFNIVLIALIAAVLGGMAIAGERRERSAEFIALLPVARWHIVLSKWLISLGITLVAAVTHTCVGWWFESHWGWHELDEIQMWVCTCLAMFGIAWVLGSFLGSATLSSCTGIGLTLAMMIVIEVSVHDSQLKVYSSQRVMLYCLGGVAVLSLIGGTAVIYKRVAP